jgi:hypothetical protein
MNSENTANIYNSNGSLTGNRVINAGNKNLELSGTAGRNALTIRRTDDEVSQGIAFRNSGAAYDALIYMEKRVTLTDGLVFATGGNSQNIENVTPTMTLSDDSSIRFNAYGTGIHNGTTVNLLGVDANGNVIESSKEDAEKNIYNNDGALTQNRIINTNDHPISFQNSAGRDFSIIPADPSSIELPFIFKTQNAFTFQVDSFDALAIDSDSHLKFGRYGDVTQQIGGTAVFQLGVDATGNIIELDMPQTTSGMQYYSYNLANFTAPPSIIDIRTLETADKTGFYTKNLSSPAGALTDMKPSNNDYYAIKVTGVYFATNPGTFNFTSSSNDGTRIYIDRSLVLDAWTVAPDNIGNASVNLAKGKHTFEFWYFQHAAGSDVSFSWGVNPDSRSGVIDASQFTID